jgi:hypothetical protein
MPEIGLQRPRVVAHGSLASAPARSSMPCRDCRGGSVPENLIKSVEPANLRNGRMGDPPYGIGYLFLEDRGIFDRPEDVLKIFLVYIASDDLPRPLGDPNPAEEIFELLTGWSGPRWGSRRGVWWLPTRHTVPASLPLAGRTPYRDTG